jgi:ectoine hydroxylase-related dioxygenase (phytanoyl-CoA dioxygenase family)
MNYCAGFLRQQVNQQLGLPRALVQTFEPRLQELVGYGTFAGKMGRISWQSPSVYIDEDEEVLMEILAQRPPAKAASLRAVEASG